MREVSSLELTAGTAVISVAVSMMAACSPNINDVLSDVTGTTRAGVDFGQQATAVATVSVGLLLAYATGSLIPVLYAFAIAFGMSLVYEYAYRKGITVK